MPVALSLPGAKLFEVMALRPHPQKLTVEDYLTKPDDGIRREFIDGEEYIMPSPNTRHQATLGSVIFAIGKHLERYGGGKVLLPIDVVLSDLDVVQPDITFVSDKDSQVITEANIQGPPTLVVEVLSDPARDLGKKLRLYQRHRIPEYWVVDPEAQRVKVYRLATDGYDKPQTLGPGDTLTTKHIPGLALNLTDLLAD